MVLSIYKKLLGIKVFKYKIKLLAPIFMTSTYTLAKKIYVFLEINFNHNFFSFVCRFGRLINILTFYKNLTIKGIIFWEICSDDKTKWSYRVWTTTKTVLVFISDHLRTDLSKKYKTSWYVSPIQSKGLTIVYNYQSFLNLVVWSGFYTA